MFTGASYDFHYRGWFASCPDARPLSRKLWTPKTLWPWPTGGGLISITSLGWSLTWIPRHVIHGLLVEFFLHTYEKVKQRDGFKTTGGSRCSSMRSPSMKCPTGLMRINHNTWEPHSFLCIDNSNSTVFSHWVAPLLWSILAVWIISLVSVQLSTMKQEQSYLMMSIFSCYFGEWIQPTCRIYVLLERRMCGSYACSARTSACWCTILWRRRQWCIPRARMGLIRPPSSWYAKYERDSCPSSC
jgi:hypothetical protein